MEIKSPKDLIKWANACRKAGIQSFKGMNVEFTLSESLPTKPRSKSTPGAKTVTLPYIQDQGAPEGDQLPYEQLLNWSVIGSNESEASEEQAG